MGYYIRILGTNPSVVPLKEIREAASPGLIVADDVSESDWEEVALKHPSGDQIAIIERNPVVEGELGSDEILEFIGEVGHYKPESGARWLQSYLRQVKVIYAFQVRQGAYADDGWTLIRNVHTLIWNIVGGIIQADGEGFTNEAGYTILWQFEDNASGPWNVGVLNSEGQWKNFEIDLGNPEHRNAFQDGNIPSDAKML